MDVKEIALCGPITSIEILNNLSLIIYSQGSCLYLQDFSNTFYFKDILDPLEYNNILEIKRLLKNKIVYYSNKKFKIIQIKENKLLKYEIIDLNLFKQVNDFICDINEYKDDYIMVGYAQNYIEIYSINDNNQLIGMFKVSIPCVLFSMTIFSNLSYYENNNQNNMNNNHVLIASGTAFGKILLWSPLNPICNPISTLEGHTGVIFRMKWFYNETTKKLLLASVSDDRSVRVWNISSLHSSLLLNFNSISTITPIISKNNSPTCIYVGWGHICRVWDVLFLSNGLVTCSEDGTIKVWNFNINNINDDNSIDNNINNNINNQEIIGSCMSTMAGHGKNIWRIALLQTENTINESPVIVSVGNDSSIKFWPINVHNILQRSQNFLQNENENLFTEVSEYNSVIPEVFKTVTIPTHGNRRLNCAAAVSLSLNGLYSIIVLLDGTIWFVEMKDNLQNISDDNNDKKKKNEPNWIHIDIHPIDEEFHSGVTGVSIKWFEDINQVAISIIRSNGRVCFIILEYHHQQNEYQKQNDNNNNNNNLFIHIISYSSWIAHEGKGINTWILRKSINNNNIETFYEILTCSVGGKCSVYKLLLVLNTQNIDNVNPTLTSLVSFQSSYEYQRPCNLINQQNIITINHCIATSTGIVSYNDDLILIIGDCRGNLSAYNLNSFYNSDSSFNLTTFCYLRAHGLEVVSYITDINQNHQNIDFERKNDEKLINEENIISGFCTLGHDGYINIFIIETINELLSFRILTRFSCIPITAPDQLFLFGKGVNCSIYVGGFQASEYVIWDIRRKYQLLRIEAGGWKRPHYSSLNFLSSSLLPGVSFIFLSPYENNTKLTCLRYNSNNTSQYFNLPLHLGVPSHGKVAYAATFIPVSFNSSQLIAVGGEDGCIKLFSFEKLNSSSLSLLKFIQEVQMPMNTAVRSISQTSSLSILKDNTRSRGIIIAAGGKLSYSVWSYDLKLPLNLLNKEKNDEWPLLSCLQFLCSSMMGTPSRKRNNSKRKVKESQNQRKKPLNKISEFEKDNEDNEEKEEKEDKGENEDNEGNNHIEKDTSRKSSNHHEDQDHRILSVSSSNCYIDVNNSNKPVVDDVYVAILGDSKGLSTLLLIDSPKITTKTYQRTNNKNDSQNTLEDELSFGPIILEEFFPSEYPLLSCEIASITIHENNQSNLINLQIGIYGDTTGDVSLWTLSSSSINYKKIHSSSTLITRYPSHTMGSNCLNSVVTDIEINSNESNDIISIQFKLFITSGGDDQSINIALFSFHYDISPINLTSNLTLNQESIFRINDASGSALKGINFISRPNEDNSDNKNLYICSVGYDQRLTLWTLNSENLIQNHDSRIQVFKVTDSNCPLIWTKGSMVNVGDVNSLASISNSFNLSLNDSNSNSFNQNMKESFVGVIGEGFQIFRLG